VHQALHTTNQQQGRTVHKTLMHEWAYGMSFQSSVERNRWLSRYLAIYNGRRCLMSLAGRTPVQQLGRLLASE
jgi:hypothetical protein